jgi:large subunit ribosomal protein L27
MSKKKQGGKTKQQKRPQPKYLGVKVSDGQKVTTGSILVRQRGAKIAAGKNTILGRDFSVVAIKSGVVKFSKRLGKVLVNIVD